LCNATLQVGPADERVTVLEAYVLMAQRQKDGIDRALNNLLVLVSVANESSLFVSFCLQLYLCAHNHIIIFVHALNNLLVGAANEKDSLIVGFGRSICKFICCAHKSFSPSFLCKCVLQAQRDQHYVPALLAMANAFTLIRQQDKAKNTLKRISKMRVNPDYSAEFEKSWLMLADVYINIGKYDLAQLLCKKALGMNKSSGKSWEMLGLIMEKELAYGDAADNYELAVSVAGVHLTSFLCCCHCVFFFKLSVCCCFDCSFDVVRSVLL
jgi:tetratricopeptide (TPR) repeat protein